MRFHSVTVCALQYFNAITRHIKTRKQSRDRQTDTLEKKRAEKKNNNNDKNNFVDEEKT